MKDLKTVLLNPFPTRVSPFVALLQEESNRWINEDYSRLPVPFVEMLKKLNPAYWAAYCWPDAPLAVFRPITRLVVCGISFDDYYAPQPEALSKANQRIAEFAAGAAAGPEENPILCHISTYMREFENNATDAWMKRFNYHISEFLEGVEIDAQISYRKNVKYPSVKEYIPIRQKAMGASAIMSTIELVTGILPDFIAVHPFIQQASLLAGDLMGWGNDLISVEKELGDDEALNLVLVIKNETQCTLEEAFDEAVKMYNARVEEYLLLYNNVPDFGAHTPLVKKFLEGQGLWISGQIHWFDFTSRYRKAKQADYNVA